MKVKVAKACFFEIRDSFLKAADIQKKKNSDFLKRQRISFPN